MDFPVFLAITPEQFKSCVQLPGHTAWMGCRFSQKSLGLEGIPGALPLGSVLMVTDESPIRDHDPRKVASQLRQAAGDLRCKAVLLDLQRPPTAESSCMVDTILSALPCPAAVPEVYGKGRSCGILAAPALWTDPRDVLRLWKGRPVWLELGEEAALVTVTEGGSSIAPAEPRSGGSPQLDKALQVEYRVQRQTNKLLIHLQRTAQQLQAYRALIGALGFHAGLMLYG